MQLQEAKRGDMRKIAKINVSMKANISCSYGWLFVCPQHEKHVEDFFAGICRLLTEEEET